VTDIYAQLALACVAAGLLAGSAAVLSTRNGVLGLQIALEFWVAAGLLRLTGDLTWSVLAGAAAIVALRQLLNYGLRVAPLHLPPGLVGRPARRSREP
jgi:hypothetical protein